MPTTAERVRRPLEDPATRREEFPPWYQAGTTRDIRVVLLSPR